MGSVVDLKMAAAGDEQNPDAARITFDDFWRSYPRRVARKDAEKAWAKIHPESYPKILAAIAAHRKSEQWRKDDGHYIPYPASWLRGERWDDELEADLSMGQCAWNINGNRDGEVRCDKPGTQERRGLPYCAKHALRIN